MAVNEGARAIGKRAVSKQISEAGRELFERFGFEATSVDEIALLAGISPRTFYRYFSSKEELVLSWLDDLGPVVRRRLIERPASEPMLEALRRCLDPFSSLTGQQKREFDLVARLSQESPSLHSGILQHWEYWEHDLSLAIGIRMNVDTTQDDRPSFYAAFTMAGLRAAWRRRALIPRTKLATHLDRYFLLRSGPIPAQ
ncbi:transcriptional regulator, TetR family [Variovorax sp. HW608]|uniref:TetR/AcrR family transcriptional regulator n=1 Tax=Variovorax sp. HW608 TaxID=1034889 RepID=UPI00081F9178|nr:TetR family transcriptional regulator [Variovorax sp. HW608]SCK42685.1 transcriptional regulator, TetR family [Variovorax sp. HW608]